MPTWQFQTHLNPNQTVTIPPEVAIQLPPESEVHVVLVTGENDDADWEHLAAEQFLEGYAPGDDIYDQLPEG
jgi:hypothetical protein